MHDVSYDDVCIRSSPNPIYLDTAYSANGPTAGTKFPTFVDITMKNVRISGGGKISLNGYSKEHRIGVNLDGVGTTDSAAYKYSVVHGDFKLGPGPVNLKLEGEDNNVTGTAGSGSLPSCSEKLVPFPR